MSAGRPLPRDARQLLREQRLCGRKGVACTNAFDRLFRFRDPTLRQLEIIEPETGSTSDQPFVKSDAYRRFHLRAFIQTRYAADQAAAGGIRVSSVGLDPGFEVDPPPVLDVALDGPLTSIVSRAGGSRRQPTLAEGWSA